MLRSILVFASVLVCRALLAECDHCPPLEPPGREDPVVLVTNIDQLREELVRASPGTTIRLAKGVYKLVEGKADLNLYVPGVTLRGVSGNRDDVVIEGGGNNIAIFADDCTVADLTLRSPRDHHNIQVHGELGIARTKIYNVHMLDAGQQIVKVSAGNGTLGKFADNGLVACSLLEFTTHAPSDYTNGVDVLAGKGWVIRDNVFRRIRGPRGNAGPAIMLWRNSMDSVVRRNLIIDCWRGIALGLTAPNQVSRGGASVLYDHQNGLVENNVIISLTEKVDSALENSYALNSRMFHNTVFTPNSSVTWSIEYRFPGTTVVLKNNLTNQRILNRSPNQAQGILEGNITVAQASWFEDLPSGDFHLKDDSLALDKGVLLSELSEDFDGDARHAGQFPDPGADESGSWSVCGTSTLGPFIRGDYNGDGSVAGQVTDAVFLLRSIFAGGSQPTCLAACDGNGDGEIDVTDAVFLLQFNFLGGRLPSHPFPECGPGETAADQALGCELPPQACG